MFKFQPTFQHVLSVEGAKDSFIFQNKSHEHDIESINKANEGLNHIRSQWEKWWSNWHVDHVYQILQYELIGPNFQT